MTNKIENPVEIDETDLDATNGGIGLLLPAVQKVREAAARSGSTYQGTTTVNQGVLNTK